MNVPLSIIWLPRPPQIGPIESWKSQFWTCPISAPGSGGQTNAASADGDGAIGKDPSLDVHRDDGCTLNQQIGGFRRGRHEASRIKRFISIRLILSNSTTRSRREAVSQARKSRPL